MTQPIKTHERLDLFHGCAIQNSITHGSYRSYRPLAAMSKDTPIEFNITSAYDEVLFFDKSKYKISVGLVFNKIDGSAITAAEWQKIGLCNNSLHSLYENVTLSINGKHVSGNSATYAYTSYFKNLFDCSDGSKRGPMSAVGYYTIPNPQDYASTQHADLAKPGTADLTTSAQMEFCGRPNLDIFDQHKAMIGGADIRLVLTPKSAAFYILNELDNIKYTVSMSDAEFSVFVCKLSPQVDQALNMTLKENMARYHFERHETHATTIPTGAVTHQIDNLLRGQLPRKIFLAFIPNTAYNGSFKQNPFKFKHYDVRSISLFRNNELINGRPLTPNFAANKTLDEYLSLYEALNGNEWDSKFTLSRKEWKTGNTIFGFNLSEDLSEGNQCDGYLNVSKHGSMRLDLTFGTALPEVVTVLLYCVYDSNLFINGYRQVGIDF